MRVWEVEGLGRMEEPQIIQGLQEGWLLVDDRIRLGMENWGRIRVKLRQKFEVKVLVDPPSAYAGRYSTFGAMTGVALAILTAAVLAAKGLVPANRWAVLAIVIAGIVGWKMGHIAGKHTGRRRYKKLSNTRLPVPDRIRSSRATRLTVKTRRVRGVSVLDLQGDITIAQWPDLRAALIEAMNDKTTKSILLNMGSVEAVDGSGLGEIIKASKDLKEKGEKLGLFCLTDRFKAAASATDLERVVEIFKNEKKAVAAFGNKIPVETKKPMELHKRVIEDIAVITVANRLALPNTKEFRDVFSETAAEGHRGILVFLKEGLFCDSSGIGEMIRAYTVAGRWGCLLVLRPTERVYQLLSMTGTFLKVVLPPSADEEDAIEFLRGGGED